MAAEWCACLAAQIALNTGMPPGWDFGMPFVPASQEPSGEPPGAPPAEPPPAMCPPATTAMQEDGAAEVV